MSSLTTKDKQYLEKILEMGSGYVLRFTDATFEELFKRHDIKIHSQKYQNYGTSKAKKMRSFWEQASDEVVSQVLSEMLDTYEVNCELNDKPVNSKLLKKCRKIVSKLSENNASNSSTVEEDFLEKEFKVPNLHKLPLDKQIEPIIKERLNEARIALKAKASLSVVFLCGSVLEGVLLGAAKNNPKMFNKAASSPKDSNGKVLPFHQWSLAQYIDTACELKLLKLDVKKFSHGLRDFRNYIHPYEQMVSGFTPDQHTAKVCFQVLKAALANLARDR